MTNPVKTALDHADKTFVDALAFRFGGETFSAKIRISPWYTTKKAVVALGTTANLFVSLLSASVANAGYPFMAEFIACFIVFGALLAVVFWLLWMGGVLEPKTVTLFVSDGRLSGHKFRSLLKKAPKLTILQVINQLDAELTKQQKTSHKKARLIERQTTRARMDIARKTAVAQIGVDHRQAIQEITSP